MNTATQNNKEETMPEDWGQTKPADCKLCHYYGLDCNPDDDEITEPCDAFEPFGGKVIEVIYVDDEIPL